MKEGVIDWEGDTDSEGFGGRTWLHEKHLQNQYPRDTKKDTLNPQHLVSFHPRTPSLPPSEIYTGHVHRLPLRSNHNPARQRPTEYDNWRMGN